MTRTLVVVVITLVGCVAQESRGVPLYPPGAQPRRRDEVALLRGPVTFVDGARVASRDDTFELLPGCHIVTVTGRTGKVDPLGHGGWVATLPSLTYAFRMRAGGTYSIDLEIDPALGLGPDGTGRVVAREQDAQGRTSIVPRVRDSARVDDCRRWVPGGP
jgi:hypothetical protein